MSLIERVADMLGPVGRPESRPVKAPPEEIPAFQADRIERLAAHGGLAADAMLAGAPEQAGVPDADVPVVPAPRTTTRTVTIDLDRLQRQSIITPDSGRTPMAESFRRVKRHVLANIANAEPGVPANLVMVTSPLANEGKTFCAVNLAISLATELERTVLLVDADVAKPSVPSVLGVKIEQGLMDMLFERGGDLADVLCKTNIDKLVLLPAGKGRLHATELLASDAMGALLQEMSERYGDRIIIFDSPPLLAASESSVLASRMGQIVMVIEAGKTTESALKESLMRVESCRNVGLLLNKVDGPAFGYGNYGYGYGYGYGS